MRIIHFLGNYRNCFTRHYHPVRLFKQALLQEGIKTHFFTSPVSPGIKNCDVLAFFADGFREILPVKSKNDNTVFGYLGDFFNQFSWVVWFDDNDSSGLLEPNAFSLVDVYVKAQILKDTGYYLEDHLIGALHRDYAHQQFGVEDRKLFKGRITKQDLGKLRLGWNLSLVNWNYYNAKSKAEKLWFF